MWSAQLPLVGPGGEAIDLDRTFSSHGLASLPPMRLDEEAGRFTITLALADGRARTVSVARGRGNTAEITSPGRAPSRSAADDIDGKVRHILRLDEDLSPFYALAADDAALAWVTSGAGRMIRSATVFEEVVKTVCTTNCAWSATVRMTTALVEHLGEAAPDAPQKGWEGRAFPRPEAVAAAGEPFFREVVRAGYRGRYLIDLATEVAEGRLDLEALGTSSREELSDDELEAALLALPGVGPYAAAHIMMMLGRYSRLILDSWTRPTYARLIGKRSVADSTIVRRFRRYGVYAGLAFWLFLTRDWLEDGAS
jgi:3-methyladenine DNA glycosylase/8-oxoguanine DNA glycosylase